MSSQNPFPSRTSSVTDVTASSTLFTAGITASSGRAYVPPHLRSTASSQLPFKEIEDYKNEWPYQEVIQTASLGPVYFGSLEIIQFLRDDINYTFNAYKAIEANADNYRELITQAVEKYAAAAEVMAQAEGRTPEEIIIAKQTAIRETTEKFSEWQRSTALPRSATTQALSSSATSINAQCKWFGRIFNPERLGKWTYELNQAFWAGAIAAGRQFILVTDIKYYDSTDVGYTTDEILWLHTNGYQIHPHPKFPCLTLFTPSESFSVSHQIIIYRQRSRTTNNSKYIPINRSLMLKIRSDIVKQVLKEREINVDDHKDDTTVFATVSSSTALSQQIATPAIVNTAQISAALVSAASSSLTGGDIHSAMASSTSSQNYSPMAGSALYIPPHRRNRTLPQNVSSGLLTMSSSSILTGSIGVMQSSGSAPIRRGIRQLSPLPSTSSQSTNLTGGNKPK